MAEDRVPEVACSTGGQWVLRIPISDGGYNRESKSPIELPLRAILEHVRANVPHLWKEVDEAAGKVP